MKIINLSVKFFALKRLWTILIVTFLLVSVMPNEVQAQNITNYTFAATSGTYTALSSPTNPVLSGGTVDDGYFNNIPIGFDFWYMGTLSTTVSASTNGWLTLGADITNATFSNNLSGGGAPRPVIAPLWDDLDIQTATNFAYKVSGSAPNRVLTIEYLNAQWNYNATGNTISFQVKLYEGTGKIEFIYRPEAGTLSTPSASIGLSSTATGSGNFLSLNGTGIAPTVSSTTETTTLNTKPASGQTYSFTPPVAVLTAPTSLTFTGIAFNTMTLNWVDNSGNESGFSIYRSTDGVNYSFISQTASNTTTSLQTGLSELNTYYWRVYAFSEGGGSTPLSGSQITAAAPPYPYAFTPSNGTFTALSGATSPALSGGTVDDGYFNALPIGFDFWYMGNRYTTVSVSTNGWLTPGSNISNATLANDLPGGGAPRPVLAPLWDDLDIQVVTNVSYKTTGIAPNRVFTVQYLNVKWYYLAAGNVISFQVKFYESTGKIEFVYRPEATAVNTPSASIGITFASTGSQYFLSVNDARTSASSTTEASVTTKPISGKTYAFASAIPIAPGSLTFSNVGTVSMTLNWSDLSSNEKGFVIYKSIDGVAYTFATQTAAGTTSSAQAGLMAGTTYYWKVYAVSDGGLSTALSGSQATCTAPNISQIPITNLILNYKFAGNANDESGADNGTLQGAPTLTTDRFGIANKAYSFNGSSQYVSTANSYLNPGNISISIWFKTSTVTGGMLMGFGSAQTGLSGNHDRKIYMNNAGQVYFGIYTGATVTINTTLSYNDNNWHLVTATMSTTAGMVLYIDGVQVGSNANTVSQNYTGYWRIGYDNLSGWPSTPTSYYFNGTLDDALVYHTALNSTQVAILYNSPDGAGGNTPVCAGTPLNLTATTVGGASYAWTGPNGFTSSSQNPTFTYSSSYAGVYTLQVTSGGCSSTAYKNVSTAATSSTISYAGSPYCTNAVTASVTFSGTTGGTYASTAGLIISATTGAVTLGTSTAGTYAVTYTIAGGCAATASMIVATAPTTSVAGADQTGAATCGLTTVTLAANAPSTGTGAWSIISGTGGSVTTPTSATSTFTGTAGTTYTLRWTISSSTCTASTDDVVIAFNVNPTSVSGTATETCVGGSTGTIMASASGGSTPYTYSLNAGAYQASATFTGLAAATFTLNVNSNAGCIASTSVIVSPFANSADDQNATATDTWIGHMYDGTAFTSYIGQFTEAETFDELFGGSTVCFNVVSSSVTRSIYTESFSVKFKMASTKQGLYVADLGSDDGSRLTVDGTMVYNNWSDQGISTKPRVLMNLNGASALLYEFYENGGGNQVLFQNFTLVLANTLSTNTTQSICIGNTGSAISGDTYGVLPSGITLSGTGYQWSYSTTPGGARTNIAGETAAAFTPSASVAPFNSAGTYYIYRNAVLNSANNISPNPYIATNESNAATITVAPVPSATISYAGSPYCSNAGAATIIRNGTADGTYSAAAGLTIDANTGDITLASSTAGTYTVTYTMTATGGCSEQTATTSVTITALPAATISYAGSPYTQNGGTVSVISSGTAGGTYSSTAGLSINSITGAITLGTSTLGTYTVTYTVAAVGGCIIYTTTANITVVVATKTFTGTGNFSDAARWTDGTLPVIGENLVIDGVCMVDNNAGTDNIAYGTLIIGTATSRTLDWAVSGTNRLNVSNVSAGAAASTFNMTNGGTLIIRGTWASANLTFTSGAGTIEIQSTITLPAAYTTYNNLIINGSGITVKPGVASTLNGNVTITDGTLNANNLNLSVKGNWTNNVSTTAFTAGTATVTFNGTTPQAIGGAFASTFNNLTVANNVSVVTLNVSVSITGNLSVNAGTFDLGVYTANRATAGGTLNLSNNTTLKIGGTNTFPTNFTTNTLVVASTVEYSGINQAIADQTYGNLTLSSSSGAAVKTFPGTALAVIGNLSSTLGTGASVSFTAASNITIDGNVSIGASTSFNGGGYLHSIAGNWVNNGTFDGNTSTITFAGAGKAVSGSGTQNFNNLTVAASGVTFSSGSITLAGNLATTGSGSFVQASGGTLLMSGAGTTISGTGISLNNLTVSGSVSTAISLELTGNLSVSGSFTASASTITMSGASKTMSGAGTSSFTSLNMSGSISTATNFFISSGLTISGSLSASAGTATFTGTATLSGTANLFNTNINGTSLQLSANSNLGIANVLTIIAGTLDVTSSGPNTVNFNGGGAQNINAITYSNLVLSNGNTKTAVGAITTAYHFTIGTGTTFDASTYTHSVYGDWINNGTFTPGTSTIEFLGPATANIIGGSTTFNILTSNTSTPTTVLILQTHVTADIVNMTNGMILTGSDTLTITNTRTGNGNIYGNIQRTHSFTTGTAYAFKSPYNTITFSSVSTVTSITVSIIDHNIGDFPFGAAVNAEYNINVPAGTYNATLRLAYEDDELNGGDESTMGLWNYNGSSWINIGKTSNDITYNYVEQSGLTNITNRWAFSSQSNLVQWNGSVSTDWNTAVNWTALQGSPSLPPSASDIVDLGTATFTNQPTISNSVSINSIHLGSIQAVTLSLASGGSLTVAGNIDGDWTGNATHAINVNNQNLSVNGDLILSDEINGQSVDLNIGTGIVSVLGSLFQAGDAIINFSSSGTLNIYQNYDYISGTFNASDGTVAYIGNQNQIVANITYNNLTINKTAGLASINSITVVGGNLTVTAGEVDNFSTTTITGNVTISSGATLQNLSILHIGGNWVNNGTYAATGASIFFDGSGTQTISATTFNNFNINKPVGSIAELTGNLIIKENLTIASGTLNIKSFSCDRNTPGGNLILGDSATFIVGANNAPFNFTGGSISNSSTVIADGTGPQSIYGNGYGNIIFRNAGLKTLITPITVNGTLTIESGAVFDGGSQTLTMNGNWINSGTFTPSTSMVLLNGTLKTISGSTTFNRVTVTGSYTLLNNVTFNALLNITSAGSLSAGGTILVTMNGDLINSGILYTLGTTTFTGNVIQTLSLINAVQTVAITVNFNGSVSPVLNSTSAPQFGYLNINNTGGVNPSVGWAIAYGLTVGSGGSFNGGNSTHNILGFVTNNGTITSSGTLNFIPASSVTINLGSDLSSTGTVNFGGAGALTLSGTASSFQNVVISNTNIAGIASSTNWNITNNFTINSGSILNAGNRSLTVGGNLTNSGTINCGTSTFTLNGAGAQDIYTLSAFYNLTINKAADTAKLTSTVTANGELKIMAGIVDLNALTLSATGTSTFNAGTINNGIVNSTGAVSTFAGTIFGAKANATSNEMYLDGSTFNDTATLTKTGTTDIVSTGGNTFNGPTTISDSSTGYWILGNTAADIFNGNVTFNNSGDDTLQIAFNTPGNQFNGDVTFNNTGTGSTIRSSSGSLATTSCNGNIVVNNTSSGEISFGGSGGLTTLAATKTITIGGTGFASGSLLLRDFTQMGSTVQALTLTGTALLQTGPSAIFNGNVTFISPQVLLNGSTFNGTASIRKSGAIQNNSIGGNIFVGAATLTNTGSGIFQLGFSDIDIFNDLTLINTGTSAIQLANNVAGHQFNGNISLRQSTGTGIYFCAGTGTASLADGKTLSIVTGFSAGALNFARFTQIGTTPQAFTLTGTALLEMGPAVVFNADVNFIAPQLLLNGTTFNGITTLKKNGASNNVSTGGNIFNGITTLNCSSSGSLDLGNTLPETFNTDLTVNNTGTSRVQIGIGSVGNLFNGNTTINHGGNTGSLNTIIARNPGSTATFNGNLTLNCTNLNTLSGIIISNEGAVVINGNVTMSSTSGRGILFSDVAGSVTLANGFTISDAGAGTYTTGTLKLARFIQTGGTDQNIALTGTAMIQSGPTSQFNGAVNFTAPQLYLNGCQYNNTAVLRKNGATDNASVGNNIFNGTTTISNNGTGYLRLGSSTADDFNSDATFVQTGSGLVRPAYGTNCTIAGNLSTTGTATAITFGNTVTLNGTAAQSISSTLSPTFTNLIISNTGNTVTSGVNSSVTSDLSVTSGTFDLLGFTADRSSSGGTLSLSGNATLKIGGTNTYPTNYTTNTLAATSTVEYSGTSQAVKALNYSNLTLSGSGTKSFPVTSLTIYGDLQMAGTTSADISNALTVNGGLSIGNWNNLSVSSLATLSVSGTLSNSAGSAGFVLHSDSSGTASLIHNTDNVPATVERYINGDAEAWHFLSAPISNQGISGTWLPSGTYGNGTGYDLYVWNEPTNCWIYKLNTTSIVNWNTIHPGSDFTPGRGYLYSVQATNPTKEFVGNLNNSSLTYPLTFNSTDLILKGFNLVGNPYPSSIDWGAASGWSRNDLANSGGGYDMWIWNQTANNYGVYNSFTGTGTNSVTRYIAPMQGYFVRASVAGDLGLNNDVRVHNGASWFKNAEINPAMVSVVVYSDADKSFDEALLLFGYSTNDQLGATKLFSPVLTAPSLYLSSGNEKYSVQYLTDTVDNPTVPILFKPGKDGNFTLHCNFDTDKFEIVMLEDRHMHYLQNLKAKNTYNFLASKTDDANRFVLHFGPENNSSGDELPAWIYSDGIQIIIDLKLVRKETTVMVYDVLGRKLLQRKLQGETQHVLSLKASKQILIVYLKNPDGSFSRKLVWAGN